jgi:hypothetical protein
MQHHDKVLACLERYNSWVSRQLTRTHWCGDETKKGAYEGRAEWISARRKYLEQEYAKALNDADNVIGKQWSFDAATKWFNPVKG